MDVNRFARSTSWAHGFMAAYFQRAAYPLGAGVLVMAFLLLVAWWRCRRSTDHMAAVIWAVLGAAASYGLALVLDKALAQARPYSSLRHVEVLVVRAHTYGFPDARAAVCGAVVCGLVLARRWALLALALMAGLLTCFAGVYVGAIYPSDAAGGAVFGAAVVLVLWPLASRVFGSVVGGLAGSALSPLVESRRPSTGPRTPVAPVSSPVRLPNARAMEALRAASEAARSRGQDGLAGRPD